MMIRQALLLIAALPTLAFSQEYEDYTARFIRETREKFVRDQMELSLRALEPNRDNPVNADRNFIVQVPKFRQAVEAYRNAMGVGPTQKPLKQIDRFVETFTDYFEQTKVDGAEPDPTEFVDFTPKELLWETLTTAERVDMKLRQAVLLVNDAITSNVINIKAMLFLRGLHGELRRLQLLISKVNKT
jgi:hypothetical protein